MEMNPMNNMNHEGVNAIIMAVKKSICYKDRLKTHDQGTNKSTLEGIRNVEIYKTRQCIYSFTMLMPVFAP